MNQPQRNTERTFTPLKKYAPLFIPLVAVGGLWYPKLGLLILPMMLTLAVMGFLRGKYWCGNICPHGAWFDGIVRAVSRNGVIPPILRSPTIVGLAFAWFMFMLGWRIRAALALWGTLDFLDQVGYIFTVNYLVVTIVGTALALVVSPRAWCSFCPMGTFQVIMYRLGRALRLNRGTDVSVHMPDPAACRECGLCARVCPMQLEPHRNLDEDGHLGDDACIRCGVCVKSCPAGALRLGTRTAAEGSSEEARRVG